MSELITVDRLLSLIYPYSVQSRATRSGTSSLALTPPQASLMTLTLIEELAENHAAPDVAKLLVRFLTPEAYQEIVQERTINHICGYILCGNQPKDSNNSPQINFRRPSIILPNTYYSSYCCKLHYQSSLFYEKQLSPEALFARTSEILEKPYGECAYERDFKLLDDLISRSEELHSGNEKLVDLIQSIHDLKIDGKKNDDESQLAGLLRDFHIVEKEGGLQGEIDAHTYGGKYDNNDGVDDENHGMFLP